MVYSEKFIAVVKCNGQILREHDSVVTLPFGSEYSLLLKNLNSTKALVSISIDGKDVLDKNEIIVQPNTEINLEGFLDGFKVKNKFKFIQKTKEIVKYRGDRVDDGIIRVEFTFEKQLPIPMIYDYRTWVCPTCHCNPCTCWIPVIKRTWFPPVFYGSTLTTGSAPMANSVLCSNFVDSNLSNLNPDEGITVKGSEANQNFMLGSVGEIEEKRSVIIIKLRGVKSNGTPVEKPVLTKKKLKCETCGKSQRSSAKFCSRCGTNLI